MDTNTTQPQPDARAVATERFVRYGDDDDAGGALLPGSFETADFDLIERLNKLYRDVLIVPLDGDPTGQEIAAEMRELLDGAFAALNQMVTRHAGARNERDRARAHMLSIGNSVYQSLGASGMEFDNRCARCRGARTYDGQPCPLCDGSGRA